MTSPEGGFYSATDADSEGVEGKFFVWTPEEIARAVGNDEDARRFCAYYDISPRAIGSIRASRIAFALEDVARDLDITPDELKETIHRVKPLVYRRASNEFLPASTTRSLRHGTA